MLKGSALAVLGGAAALGAVLKDSIGEAREAQKVGAVTAQVIKSTGAAAKITANQVGDLSTAISNHTGIDDEAIQSGANLLLTFKNIRNEAGKGNDIFNQTTSIMTDMATAMGTEPKAAAIQLGKALNDPIKGITALTRVGVTFSDGQKKQIKAMVESGDVMGAQKVILKELNSEFGGTAAAASTAGEKFKTAFGNLEEQIGTALLPAIDKVAGFLTAKVVPAVSTFIGQLQTGEGVGGRVRRVFDNITDAVKTVATWGKTDLFPALRNAYNTVLPGVKQALDDVLPKVKGIAEVSWGKLQSGIDALKSLTSIDFSKIDGQKLGQQLTTAAGQALSSLSTLGGKVLGALTDMFSKVDWIGLGIKVGTFAIPFVLGLATGIINGITAPSLWLGIWNHLPEILIAGLAVALAPTKLIGPIAKILTKIPFVGRFLAAAVTWVNELGGKLLSFGGDLLKTFWQGFSRTPIPGVGFVTKFIASIKSLPGKMHEFLVLLQTRLGVWALDAFGAMGPAARTAISALVSFVGRLPGRILGAIGSLARLLFPRGSEAIAGMAKGIADRIVGVLSTLRGLPAKMRGALGNLAKLLFSKGAELIQGLINGIKSKVADVGSAIAGVASKIKGFLPGSPIKEGPLKSWNGGGAGKRLVGLLSDGITKAAPQAAAAARDMAKKVADAARSSLAVTKTRADVKSWIASTLLPGLGGSPEKVTSTIAALGKKMQAALVSLAGPDKNAQRAAINASAAFMKSIKGQTDALLKNAKDRAALADKIKAANDKVVDAQKSMTDGIASIVDSAKSFGSILTTASDENNPLTGGSIVANLKNRLQGIKDFASSIGALIKQGLDKGVLAELVQAGPDQGAAYAKALLDSPGIVASVNDLTKQIGDEAGVLGGLAGQQLYQPGVDAALKFRDGLLSQDSALQQAGRAMIRSVENGARAQVGLKPLAMPKVAAAGSGGRASQPINMAITVPNPLTGQDVTYLVQGEVGKALSATVQGANIRSRGAAVSTAW